MGCRLHAVHLIPHSRGLEDGQTLLATDDNLRKSISSDSPSPSTGREVPWSTPRYGMCVSDAPTFSISRPHHDAMATAISKGTTMRACGPSFFDMPSSFTGHDQDNATLCALAMHTISSSISRPHHDAISRSVRKRETGVVSNRCARRTTYSLGRMQSFPHLTIEF